MFIVEGADHLGKTTICKQVLEYTKNRFPTFYCHMTRPVEHVFNFREHYVDRMSVFGVQDRFHLGGMVYHEGWIEQQELRWIEGQLLIRGSFVLIVHTSNEKWYKKHLTENSKQEMFDPEFIMNVNHKYREMVEENTCHYDIEVDVKDGKFLKGEFLDEVIDTWVDRLALQEELKRGDH